MYNNKDNAETEAGANGEEKATAGYQESGVATLLDGENQYPLVSGVLAVKVVSAEIRTPIDPDSLLVSRVSVRNTSKYTGKAKRWGSKLTWGEMMYFPVRVIRNPRHPFNLFKIDVMAVPYLETLEDAAADPSNVVGSVPFHVHDLIKGAPSSGTFTILKGHRPVGNVMLEIYYAYGSFGFGYSPQFQSLEVPERHVEFSILPRAEPDGPKDEWSQTTIAPTKNCTLLNEEKTKEDYPLTYSRMKRLSNLKAQYDQLDNRNRLEKLAFLNKIINTPTKAENSVQSFLVVREENEIASKRNPNYFKKYMRPAIPRATQEKDDKH